MNYLFYIVVFLSVTGLILIPLWFRYRLQVDFFSKQITKLFAQKKSPFFSSFVIRKVVQIALRHHQQKIIDLLFSERSDKAAQKIEKYDYLLALLLKAFEKPETSIKKLESFCKKNPHDNLAACWLALLLESVGNKSRAQIAWDNTNSKLPPYLRAHYQAHLGESALKNGDMEFASRLFYQAAHLFNKSKGFYEEGNVYLQLATVYRVCFVDDVAETLFLSALKTFESLEYEEGIAKAHANLGVLMLGEERFDEAESYFQKALKEYENIQFFSAQAEIKNQQAFLYLLKKDYKTAQKLLTKTQKELLALNDKNGIAFNFDLLANCYWQMKNFKETIRYAKKAAVLYKDVGNISGFLESLYLQSQAAFSNEQESEAEYLLRQIIETGKQDCGCFYLANAYNLLGIIFMKRKDLQRAKGFFQQSLDLEQRGVRLNALAVDYTNIGLVEFYRGQKETAQQHLKIALDFAHQIEDEELISKIQQQIERTSN